VLSKEAEKRNLSGWYPPWYCCEGVIIGSLPAEKPLMASTTKGQLESVETL
jgi:hypothetical protein